MSATTHYSWNSSRISSRSQTARWYLAQDLWSREKEPHEPVPIPFGQGGLKNVYCTMTPYSLRQHPLLATLVMGSDSRAGALFIASTHSSGLIKRIILHGITGITENQFVDREQKQNTKLLRRNH